MGKDWSVRFSQIINQTISKIIPSATHYRGRIYFIQSTRGGRRCAPRPRANVFDPDGIMMGEVSLRRRETLLKIRNQKSTIRNHQSSIKPKDETVPLTSLLMNDDPPLPKAMAGQVDDF